MGIHKKTPPLLHALNYLYQTVAGPFIDGTVRTQRPCLMCVIRPTSGVGIGQQHSLTTFVHKLSDCLVGSDEYTHIPRPLSRQKDLRGYQRPESGL